MGGLSKVAWIMAVKLLKVRFLGISRVGNASFAP
jgi:hypothetical protein